MNDINDVKSLLPVGTENLDLFTVITSFTICCAMAFLLKSFYVKYSFTLTGKSHIAPILPILSLIVFLVILIVKSSLALSLGLVGALSIVRFRTPIKEPEELIYLFLAIAIGLGYGAGYTLMTTIITSLILFVIFFWLSNMNIKQCNEYTLVIKWQKEKTTYDYFIEIFKEKLETIKLVRLDVSKEENTAVFIIVPDIKHDMDKTIESIQNLGSDINISLYEAKTNW